MVISKSTPILHLIILVLLLDLPSHAFSDNSRWDVHLWCSTSTTPFPKLCAHYIGIAAAANPSSLEQTHVHGMAVQAAMDQTLRARKHHTLLEPRCRDAREKAAWADCVKLYDSAMRHLNRSIDNPSAASPEDVLTWLSAALTDLETCRTGFAELGLAEPNHAVFLTLLDSATQLISNSLSLASKAETVTVAPELSSEFLSWVAAGDRELLKDSAAKIKADLVVAKDGSGDVSSIKAAVEAAASRQSGRRFVIYIKEGDYKENVEVGTNLKNLMMVGDGIGKTVVTGSRSFGGGSSTYNSATFAVVADGFIARDMTFRNTAGPQNHQAVAVLSGADLSVFYKCSFEGYQDTLYTHSMRQFYRDCDVYGTVDFIFGNSAAVLQNCNIYVRRPMSKQKNTITAQGRTDPNQNTGISIHNSRVTAAPDLKPVQGSFPTFLGRPWAEYSRTVFMQTYLDGLIDAAGWLEWSGSFALNTLYYGEYKNTGPGASTAGRVGWRGYHVITDPSVAARFKPGSFIERNSWLP